MERKIRWYDYITVNIFWFALTARSQTLALIIPLLIQKFVAESTKGAALGNIRLWGLMGALLFQAFAGILSDHSTSRFGRRRPFILIGGLSEILVFIAIGVIAASFGSNNMTGYWVLFAVYILSMLSSNTAHAATQGLIPDLIPDSKHGIFSGIKAFFELPAPLIFISFVVSKLVTPEKIWPGLEALIAVVAVCVLIAMFIPEKPSKTPPQPLNWQPIIRLVFMTAAFTAIILGTGELVKFINRLTGTLPGTSALIATIAVGVLGMAIAVFLGVWASVEISIGKKSGPGKRSFTWWVINRLSFLIGSTNLSIFAVYFLQEHFSNAGGPDPEALFGQLMLFVGLSIFISSIPAGWLSDKLGKKPVCAFSGVIATIGTLVVVASANTLMLYIGGILVGVGIGIFFSASWALGTSMVPKDEAGRYLGIQNLAGAGAGAIGAYIGGPIGDGVGFTVLMGIFGLLFLVSTLALFGIKDQPEQSEHPDMGQMDDVLTE